MFCIPTILRLLHLICANIQVNKGCEYYSRGRHIGQFRSKSKRENDLNVNCLLGEFITVRLQCDPWFEQRTHLSTSSLSNIGKVRGDARSLQKNVVGKTHYFECFFLDSYVRQLRLNVMNFHVNSPRDRQSKMSKTIKAADVPFRRPLAHYASGMKHGSEF